jgi:peptidoglycan hydrolase CwlO-like protein
LILPRDINISNNERDGNPKGGTTMKKGILLSAVLAVGTMVIAGAKKLRKEKMKKETKEEDSMMSKIIENQKILSEACDSQEEMVQQAMKTISELKARLNEPEYGEDPTKMDISIPEMKAV